MTGVGVPALLMAPAVTSVAADIVLEYYVLRTGSVTLLPVFIGVLAVPDFVVPVRYVLLYRSYHVGLVGKRSVPALPYTAVLYQNVAGVSPELDTVAVTYPTAFIIIIKGATTYPVNVAVPMIKLIIVK